MIDFERSSFYRSFKTKPFPMQFVLSSGFIVISKGIFNDVYSTAVLRFDILSPMTSIFWIHIMVSL